MIIPAVEAFVRVVLHKQLKAASQYEPSPIPRRDNPVTEIRIPINLGGYPIYFALKFGASVTENEGEESKILSVWTKDPVPNAEIYRHFDSEGTLRVSCRSSGVLTDLPKGVAVLLAEVLLATYALRGDGIFHRNYVYPPFISSRQFIPVRWLNANGTVVYLDADYRSGYRLCVDGVGGKSFAGVGVRYNKGQWTLGDDNSVEIGDSIADYTAWSEYTPGMEGESVFVPIFSTIPG